MKMATIKPTKDDVTSTNSDPAVSEPGDQQVLQQIKDLKTINLNYKKPTSAATRKKYLRKAYGLTPEEVNFALQLQRNRCSDCSEIKPLRVNFNHEARTFKMTCFECSMPERPTSYRVKRREVRLRATGPTL